MAGQGDFDWAVPVMRTGYAGRALVYIVVAGISLWAILHGGQGQGTSSAFARLESAPFGKVVLFAIFVGMVAYAIWRLVDAIWDLETYGSDGEGMIARVGMCVTGLIHLAIGIGALLIVFTASGGDGQSSISKAAEVVLGWPGGRWILGAMGLATIGAGLYYGKKAYKREYRKHLRSNEVTRRWDGLLRLGVLSQGFVVTVIGFFIFYAAWAYNSQSAGGLAEVFSWLSGQPYGQILVGLLSLGLLCFALFCAVNAGYRIVPRASDPDIETLKGAFS
ncbi:protein of unknown function [Palleronia marisminoris]|uniref:DUF1206 domain-containing protein n=1 Tax=Palleronia marisminoris TaxID=315423 RepID=A0A1Y5R818_9RHOB|nr:DUF1206 domain-containing protein [Palleronia marisminoris]SFG07818.1 protein of unknown function [Palleronia marisminoris]SLN11292.1 hypothetical protein PAM7066_00096 [Palleronia marisminoris]